jgi:hypothetical protein
LLQKLLPIIVVISSKRQGQICGWNKKSGAMGASDTPEHVPA